MENNNEQSQELSIIDKSIDIIRGAGEILTNNKQRASKALAISKKILADIEANGGKMNAELDVRCQKFIVRANEAKKTGSDDRKPFTQLITAITKEFTGAEAVYDIEVDIHQKFRNQWVKEVAEENKRLAEEAEKKAAKAKAFVQIKSEIEKAYNEYHHNFLLTKKQSLKNSFNTITLENYQAKEIGLNKYTPTYDEQAFDAFYPKVNNTTHTTAEYDEIVKEVKFRLYLDFNNNFIAEMDLFKQELVDMLPSKKNELMEQKRLADEAEQKRLAEIERQKEEQRLRQIELDKENDENERKRKQKEIDDQLLADKKKIDDMNAEAARKQAESEAEQKKREQDEEERIKKEADDALASANLTSDLNKEVGNTMALYDQELDLNVTNATPETRQGYEITVTNPTGYLQLTQWWFDKEGKGLSNDKIEKTTMKQIKTFNEKWAHKNNVVHIESPFLKFEVSYKAVNRKEAKE